MASRRALVECDRRICTWSNQHFRGDSTDLVLSGGDPWRAFARNRDGAWRTSQPSIVEYAPFDLAPAPYSAKSVALWTSERSFNATHARTRLAAGVSCTLGSADVFLEVSVLLPSSSVRTRPGPPSRRPPGRARHAKHRWTQGDGGCCPAPHVHKLGESSRYGQPGATKTRPVVSVVSHAWPTGRLEPVAAG